MKAIATLLASLALSSSVAAMGVGTPQTYSKLVWNSAFGAGLFGTCQQMIFDATGDLANSSNLVLYGTINCAGGGFGMTGSLYIAVDGTMNISIMSAGHLISCPRVASYVGNCTVFDASGFARATGLISLIP